MYTKLTSPQRRVVLGSLLALALCSSLSPSFARGWGQQHPRRAEVLGRDNNINNRLNADRGNLGGNYGRLKSEDRAIRAQEQADARLNGGYITKGEQHQLNREENHLNNQIRRDYTGGFSGGGGYPGGGNFAHNHPRRAEVLGRDNRLNRELHADRGDLSGHYSQLRGEDIAIRQQEQADARANGGYITPGQQAQLNREENHVQRQINRDFQ
ncbi:MAG TPA: hypothetical protein V6C89_00135 [Drouetiella sp.]